MSYSAGSSKLLSRPSEIDVVAAGFPGGQCRPGVEVAPEAPMSADLLTQLRDDLSYTICYNDPMPMCRSLLPAIDLSIRGTKNPRAVSAGTQNIVGQAYEHACEGRCVLTLGGDHNVAIGTFAGTARAIRERSGAGDRGQVGVIWIHAHDHINTPETNGSGNLHGMPVAWLMGLAHRAAPGCNGAIGSCSSPADLHEQEVFGWLDTLNTLTKSANGTILIELATLTTTRVLCSTWPNSCISACGTWIQAKSRSYAAMV